MTSWRARFALSLLLAVSATPLMGQATLQVVGETGTAIELPIDSLRHLPQQELRGQIHDGPEIVFRGPALDAIMAMVGAPRGRDLRGPSLRLVVLAEARDGYAVVYSLAEISPDLGARRAIVAVEQDGKPLDDKDGPIRIVLEGEKRPARWIRQLERVRLVRVQVPGT